MKTLVMLFFRALLGQALVLAQDGHGPCGCIRSFDFCANDLNTYHSICEYKCKNPSTPFQEWYILSLGPCLSQPAHTVALIGRMLTQDRRGPCSCKRSFDFCANDYDTYHSICEYKCKHPSTPFKDWYILYYGPCLSKPTEAGMDTTTDTTMDTTMDTTTDTTITKDMCVKSCESQKGYEWEPRTGSCYKFHRTANTWRKALVTCIAEGGHLAIINSDTESLVLKEIFEKNPRNSITGCDEHALLWHVNDYAHIGFLDLDHKGEYITIHGQKLAEAGFEHWLGSQPDHKGIENCGSIYRDGLLNDIGCNSKLGCICEITP